jgi:SecD/SecF fusion protein
MKYPIWKPILIVAVLGLFGAIWAAKGLKPGLDLAGGTTLVYDVRIPEGRDAGQVIEDTIAVLQDRVDPTGTRNLVWRRVAGNRLEVQMALAPKGITDKREAYLEAKEKLLRGNLNKRDVVRALEKEGGARSEAFAQLAEGNERLLGQLETLAEAHAELQRVEGPAEAADEAAREAERLVENPPADITEQQQAENERVAQELIAESTALSRKLLAARSAYNAALAEVLDSNINAAELERILDLDDNPANAGRDEQGNPRPTPRQQAVRSLIDSNPDRAEQIRGLFELYEEYEEVKGPLDDPNDLITLLQGSGVLELRIGATPNERPVDVQSYIEQLAEQGPKAGADRPWKWYEVQDIERFVDRDIALLNEFRDNPDRFIGYAAQRGLVGRVYGGRYYLLLADSPQLAMTRDQDWALSSVTRASDELMRPAVGFSMDARGGALLGALTGPNVGRQMAVLLDNKVVTAPTLQAKLTSGGIITGDFSNEEFEYLIRTIKAGSLEGQLGEQPISIKTTGPTLGEENLRAGVRAAVTALIVVAVFMAIYYLFAGMVANFALLANMVIILGVMSMIEATFTLPGIAGIVLTIGMAVDANVLIFERIREELEAKADLRTAVRLGFDKALSTILDANITTLITCLVLGYTATAEIKGFAVTLGIGILATLFTALFCTRVFIDAYVRFSRARTLHMLPTIVDPIRKLLTPQVDWLHKRWLFYPLSAALLIAGMLMVYQRGAELLDIEFRSGTKVSFTLKSETVEPSDQNPEGRKLVMLPRSEAESRIESYAAIGEALQADQPVPADANPEAVEEMRRIIEDAERRHAEAVAEYEAQQAADRDADPPDAPADFALLTDASVVTEGEGEAGRSNGFSVATLMTDSQAVSDLIKAAFDDELDTTQPISFEGVAATDFARAPAYRVSSTDLSEVLGRDVTPTDTVDISDYLGGVAVLLEDMVPEPTLEDLRQRIRRMRQQPAHEDLGYRDARVIGLEIAYTDEAGRPHYRSAAVLSTDQRTNYLQTPATFSDGDGLAVTEWRLVRDALQRDTSLASVTKFSSQVSGTMKQQAIAAMALSLLAVVAYIWLRFGSIRYGIAAIAALVEVVVPAAERCGIRLAVHPQDPAYPADGLNGVHHVVGSLDGMERLLDLAPASPVHGLNFCQGTIAEMSRDPNAYVLEAIRRCGARGRIFMVHFRNIKGGYLDFSECFPDEGEVDMAACIRAYRGLGYEGVLCPDHVPASELDPEKERFFAFALGYTRGLLQAA